MNKFSKHFATASVFLLAFFLVPAFSFAQNQPNIPKPRGPIDFSQTSNIVIFVIIPAIIIIAFLIFRKRIWKVKQEKKENNDRKIKN